MKNKNIKEFVKRAEKTFGEKAKMNQKSRNYFIGYGLKFGKKINFNVIIDDRDVERMRKNELKSKLKDILKSLNPDKSNIKPRVMLISDVNEKNIWDFLGSYAEIKDIKILSTFFQVKLPKRFHETFEKLPNQFKLDDFRKEFKKITNKKYHRNTYQNWMNFLRKAEYVILKNKTYFKTIRINRGSVLKERIE